jgi:DNA polymerase-3 subunit alpha
MILLKELIPKTLINYSLEGLVKAGAFDNLNNNRQSIFNSIPSIITKSKNDFDNKDSQSN